MGASGDSSLLLNQLPHQQDLHQWMPSVTTHPNTTMYSCLPPSLLVLTQWSLQEIYSVQKDPGRQFQGKVVWKVLRMYSSSRRISLSPDQGLRHCWSPSAKPGSLTHSLTHCTSDLHHQEGPSGALPGSFLSASEECSCKARDLKRFAQSPLRWEMEVKRQGSFQRLSKKSTPRLRGDNSGSLGKGNPIPVGAQWLCGLLVKTVSFNFRLDLNVTILGCKSWMNME